MASIRTELTEHGLLPKKGWGQHFLVDRNILNKVIRVAGVEKEDVILEVGPGLGGMTMDLARRAKKVIAVEIDPKLVTRLKAKMADFSNVEIIHEDILELDFHALVREEGARLKVVANLPYHISTPVLFRFIESREVFSTLTVMLQKEVAERLVASPGKKTYGPLSVVFQSVATPSVRFLVKPSAFFPSPKVESAVVHIVWKERPVVTPENQEWFRRVARGVLSYRRKTLRNALKNAGLSLPGDPDVEAKRLGLDLRKRPETLTPREFWVLAEALKPAQDAE